jgi:hypothetical protein
MTQAAQTLPESNNSDKPHRVSPNNPCPFLRALVSQGQLPNGDVSLAEVTRVVVEVAAAGDNHEKLPAAAVAAIALAANGLSPLQLARNALGGVTLNELRNGPLDKKGAGSRILDAKAKVNPAELARLDEFASDKVDADGKTERGLDLAEITRMMDANFERAAGHRRLIDRKLMDGEWPILLKVMGKQGGKQGKKELYLSLKDVTDLFEERALPERMMRRLKSKTP